VRRIKDARISRRLRETLSDGSTPRSRAATSAVYKRGELSKQPKTRSRDEEESATDVIETSRAT